MIAAREIFGIEFAEAGQGLKRGHETGKLRCGPARGDSNFRQQKGRE
jgi:hypothetical protein